MYVFRLKKLEKNTSIITKNQQSDNIYWIINGECILEDKVGSLSRQVSHISNGYCFGDESVLQDRPNPYSVLCKTEVEVLYCSKEEFLDLPLPVKETMRKNLELKQRFRSK